MIFDHLAGIAESLFPDDVANILHRTKLFIFPGKSHEVLPRSYEQEEIDFFTENFFLPFQHIAIEDGASCVILFDEEENVQGSRPRRKFIECMPLDLSADKLDEFRPTTKEDKERQKQKLEILHSNIPQEILQKAYIVAFGYIENFIPSHNQQFVFEGAVTNVCLATKTKFLQKPKFMIEAVEPTLKNVATAVQEIMFFNNPSRFIVEKSPIIEKKKKKVLKRIRRTHQRPTYTLLTPKEIAETFELDELTKKAHHKSPIAHQRRKHYRTLKSARFTKMKGKTIIVPATWVGPTTTTKKNQRYKVMVDL